MNAVLSTLLEVTLYSSILYFVIILFKRIFRSHLSIWMHYALWGLFVLRLLVPVTFESGVRLITLPASTAGAQGNALQDGAAVHMPSGDESATVWMPGEEPPAYSQADPQVQEGAPDNIPEPQMPLPAPVVIDWARIAAYVYIAGVGVMLALHGLMQIRLHKWLRETAAPVPEGTRAVYEACRQEMGIGKAPRLCVQKTYSSPALTLELRPRLLLPAELNGDMLRYAIRHELTHFRHKDHIVRLLMLVLRSFYWFHPIVWIAFRQMEADMEAACDASVVKDLDTAQKKNYALSILALGSDALDGFTLGMGARSRRQEMERRIRGIFLHQRTRPGLKTASLFFAAMLLFTCFTTACQPGAGKIAAANTDATPTPAVTISARDQEPALQAAVAQLPADARGAATYTASARWAYSEELLPGLLFEADADILMPDVADYPIYALAPLKLTQERMDALLAYFGGPGLLYYSGYDGYELWSKAGYTGSASRSVADYAGDIAFAQTLLRNGSEELAYIRAKIEEWESIVGAGGASRESGPKEYMAPVLLADEIVIDGPAGVYDKTDGSFSAGLEWPDGARQGYVRAQMGTAAGGMEFAFAKYSGEFETSSSVGWYQSLFESTYLSEDARRLAQIKHARISRLLAENALDKNTAVLQAYGVLDGLNIPDMQLQSVEPALFERDANRFAYEYGYYITFIRAAGGIPMYGDAALHRSWFNDFYAASYGAETVSIMIGENGVESFCWKNAMEATGRLAENTGLLPLDAAQETVINRFRNYLDTDYGKGLKSAGWTIREMKLCMGYISDIVQLDTIAIMPVWRIRYDERVTDAAGREYYSEGNAFLISAAGDTEALAGLKSD